MLSIIFNDTHNYNNILLEKLDKTFKYLFLIQNHKYMNELFTIREFFIFIKDDFDLNEFDTYLDNNIHSRRFTFDEKVYYCQHMKNITLHFQHISFQGRRINRYFKRKAYFQKETIDMLNKKYKSTDEQVKINILLTTNITCDDNYYVNKSEPFIRTHYSSESLIDKYATTSKTTNEITIQDIADIYKGQIRFKK